MIKNLLDQNGQPFAEVGAVINSEDGSQWVIRDIRFSTDGRMYEVWVIQTSLSTPMKTPPSQFQLWMRVPANMYRAVYKLNPEETRDENR